MTFVLKFFAGMIGLFFLIIGATAFLTATSMPGTSFTPGIVWLGLAAAVVLILSKGNTR